MIAKLDPYRGTITIENKSQILPNYGILYLTIDADAEHRVSLRRVHYNVDVTTGSDTARVCTGSAMIQTDQPVLSSGRIDWEPESAVEIAITMEREGVEISEALHFTTPPVPEYEDDADA